MPSKTMMVQFDPCRKIGAVYSVITKLSNDTSTVAALLLDAGAGESSTANYDMDMDL